MVSFIVDDDGRTRTRTRTRTVLLTYNCIYTGSQGVYDIKSQAGAESVCMNDMGSNCGVLKTNGCTGTSNLEESSRDPGVCFSSPYDMTKLSNCDSNGGMETVTLVRHTNHTSPLKSNGEHSQQQEPMYATVKRTPRGPTHIYQYPLALVTPEGSCFDTDSCMSLTTSSNVGPPSTTAYIRIQDESGDKNLTGIVDSFN